MILIQNGPVLNQMTLQEKMVHMAEISSLFPVSSGNVHKEREATNVAGAVDADGMAPVEVSVIIVQRGDLRSLQCLFLIGKAV